MWEGKLEWKILGYFCLYLPVVKIWKGIITLTRKESAVPMTMLRRKCQRRAKGGRKGVKIITLVSFLSESCYFRHLTQKNPILVTFLNVSWVECQIVSHGEEWGEGSGKEVLVMGSGCWDLRGRGPSGVSLPSPEWGRPHTQTQSLPEKMRGRSDGALWLPSETHLSSAGKIQWQPAKSLNVTLYPR